MEGEFCKASINTKLVIERNLMAKAVKANLKMRIKGGQASAAPPVGSSLGQHGVNMMDFINPFNDQTKDRMGQNLTVHITVYEDRTMDWKIVGTPTDDLIRQKLGIDKGSGRPNSEKISKKLSDTQLTEIAEAKAADMNAEDVEAIKKMVAGTARSMGVEIEG
jgi:large subunit ribosomal protein L11